MFSRMLLLSMAAVTIQAQNDLSEARLKFDSIPNVGQYFLYNEAKTWAEGMNYCALEGGQMAVVTTDEQSDGLKTLLTSYGKPSVHIGLHDQFIESQYTTIDGSTIDGSATQWADGFPTNNPAKNCGGFTADGMQDIDCATAQTTICQLRNWPSYVPIAPHGLYNLHVESRGWQAAWEVCRLEGGNLWVVDNTDEAVAVIATLTSVTDVWIGVHRISGDDAFTNVFGKPLNTTGYSKWEPGNPFGTALSRPYVALKTRSSTSPFEPTIWTHTPSGILPFVCEHAAP